MRRNRARRPFLGLLLWGLLLSLAGCQEESSPSEAASISVYYINKAETRITPVVVQLSGEGAKAQVKETIGALEENPVELSLRTPVNGYAVQEWELLEGQLFLDVSAEYRKLSSTTEVLARAALVRTLVQIEGVEQVSMTVNQEPLTDSLGAVVGAMTADQFIDNADSEIAAYEKVKLRLYYANETGDGLVETVIQPVVNNKNVSLERLVVDKLIAGPDAESEGAYPALNPATKVLGVTIKDGVCYVNLDEGFLTQVYNVTADVVIYSIVNSLAELSNVNKVQIAVGGETNLTYRETFSLETVFERNLNLVYGAEYK